MKLLSNLFVYVVLFCVACNTHKNATNTMPKSDATLNLITDTGIVSIKRHMDTVINSSYNNQQFYNLYSKIKNGCVDTSYVNSDDVVYNHVVLYYRYGIQISVHVSIDPPIKVLNNNKIYTPLLSEFYNSKIISISIYQESKLVYSSNAKVWDKNRIEWIK